MHTVFSTVDIHPRDRFARWHAAASANIIGHDAFPFDRLNFEANLQAGLLAETSVVLFNTSAMDVVYDKSHVGRADIDQVLVCLLKSGALQICQGGNETCLEAGDIALVDPAYPYTARYALQSELLVLTVGKSALESRVGYLRHLQGLKIRPKTADAILLSQYLHLVPAHVGTLSALTTSMVEDHFLDLLAVTIAAAVQNVTQRLSTTKLFVLLKLRRAVQTRIYDPALTVANVAAAAGISVRYANSVLRLQGLSVGKLIQSTRLARCHDALADIQQSHRSIAEIALNWGFTDMTHFGRAFKAAYGLLPSAYRRLKEKDELRKQSRLVGSDS